MRNGSRVDLASNSGNTRNRDGHEELGDFSTTSRTLQISALAMGIGALCAFVALVLLRLMGLFTNLFYFGRWSTTMVSPIGNHLGVYSVLVPVAGALIIGVMARYGSERIRGHGIPETIEAILINGSRVEPRGAFLKPLSAAISIGSGGPFGDEGDVRITRCGGLAGCRTTALRVETQEPDSCRPGERCGRRRASLYHWVRAALPGTSAS